MVFCRTKLFTTKFPICGSTLLLTQFKRKDDAAEYCADLAQETLGGEVWCTRLEATVADGEKTLADQRFMSCAHEQLGYLYQITVANGWLAGRGAAWTEPTASTHRRHQRVQRGACRTSAACTGPREPRAPLLLS